MQVVALVSQKGGAGKTTLAAGLAVSGERAGLSTVLVDLDPQSGAIYATPRPLSSPLLRPPRIARVRGVGCARRREEVQGRSVAVAEGEVGEERFTRSGGVPV